MLSYSADKQCLFHVLIPFIDMIIRDVLSQHAVEQTIEPLDRTIGS